MTRSADISGAFAHPTLVDYLVVLEHESLEICLQIHVGALEVGTVGVRRGVVSHAELPGARGEVALRLIASLANARISPEAWAEAEAEAEAEANVTRPWRELLDGALAEQAEGRRQRLSLVRAELRELDAELAAESGIYEIPRPEPGPAERAALQVVAQLFDWATIDAYLDGDVEQARTLAQRRGQLCSSDAIVVANVERLQLRLLDDELAAGIAEVSQ